MPASIFIDDSFGFLKVNAQGVIILANESFLDISGFTHNELIGKEAKSLFGSSWQNIITKTNALVENELADKAGSGEIFLKAKEENSLALVNAYPEMMDDMRAVKACIYVFRKAEEVNKEIKISDQLTTKSKDDKYGLQMKAAYLESINTFVKQLANARGIYNIVKSITDNAIAKLGFEDCVVYLVNESKGTVDQVTAYGPKDDKGRVISPLSLKFGEGIVGSVAVSGAPKMVNDLSKDPRYIKDIAKASSELAVPMISEGELVGVIDSEHSKKGFFTKDHLEILSTIGTIAANKIRGAINAEQRLISDLRVRDSEAKLRSFIDSALDAVVTIDERGLVTNWNRSAEDLFGYTRDSVMGEKLSALIIPEKYREAHDQGMKHFLKTGEGPVLNKRIEIFGQHKDGHYFPAEITVISMKISGKHYFSAFIRDLTLKKNAADDMDLALQKQKELSKMKSTLISLTSHEFRTPLTTIQSNIELLSQTLAGEKLNNKAKIERNFYRINTQVERLNFLMDQVLTMSRLETGNVPFNPVNIDLKEFCQKLIKDIFDDQPDGRKVEIQVSGSPLRVEIDPDIYMHIIVNLLNNAFKYSISKPNPQLHLNFTESKVIIAIKDFGIGIPEREKEKIFDSFYRAANAVNLKGTGLGLPIAMQFTQMHGGHLSMRSRLGEGSEFFIEQPYSIGLKKHRTE